MEKRGKKLKERRKVDIFSVTEWNKNF